MIIPVLHRILVKQDLLEEKDETFKRAKAAGLHLDFDERVREQAAIDTGEVVRIGETAFKDFGVKEHPIVCGDKVVFAKHAGKVVQDNDGSKYVVLNDEDIICRVIED